MESHKWVNALLVVCYYLIVVLPHKSFGTFLVIDVFKGMADGPEMRHYYDIRILFGATIALLLFLVYWVRLSLERDDRQKLWFYMGVNIILAALIISLLFVINTELIHFPQYAAFAILIFPFTNNYFTTLIWTTLAGGLDEAYQNYYLAPNDTRFFDWNDVVTNLVGAVFGLLLIRVYGVTNRSYPNIKHMSALYGVLVVITLVIVLHIMGILSVGPDPDYPYHLLGIELEGFWHKVPPQIEYHVIRPLEGTIIIFILWALYSRIGR